MTATKLIGDLGRGRPGSSLAFRALRCGLASSGAAGGTAPSGERWPYRDAGSFRNAEGEHDMMSKQLRLTSLATVFLAGSVGLAIAQGGGGGGAGGAGGTGGAGGMSSGSTSGGTTAPSPQGTPNSGSTLNNNTLNNRPCGSGSAGVGGAGTTGSASTMGTGQSSATGTGQLSNLNGNAASNNNP